LEAIKVIFDEKKLGSS
ncbi:hypothetical protein Tco_1051069, partial [Tanacetum coccineum]